MKLISGSEPYYFSCFSICMRNITYILQIFYNYILIKYNNAYVFVVFILVSKFQTTKSHQIIYCNQFSHQNTGYHLIIIVGHTNFKHACQWQSHTLHTCNHRHIDYPPKYLHLVADENGCIVNL